MVLPLSSRWMLALVRILDSGVSCVACSFDVERSPIFDFDYDFDRFRRSFRVESSYHSYVVSRVTLKSNSFKVSFFFKKLHAEV